MHDQEWFNRPELAGTLVRLVPLQPEHAAGVLTAADDDSVFEWMSFSRPSDLAAAATLVERYLANPASIAWAQIDTHSNQLAGLTTFYDIVPELSTVAIGSTWLSRKHWQTGINTESKLLLLTRAFETLEAVRVVWHTDINNTRSQTAIERLGAHREGVLRKHRIRPDRSWRDTVTYSMLEDEWPAAKEAMIAVR